MGWGLFTEWSELQFVNYSVSEEFEDGTVGAWSLEDWEIYGPGAGGYSSSGPYGNWEADILAWLNNGSILAHDIIDWDAAQLQTRNLSTHTQESAGLSALTTYYLNGTSFLPYDPSPTFGLVGTASQYVEGDIVVTGTHSHSDQSRTYRFATVDPFTHQPVTWAENATFLDMARANADANVIRFDLAEGELPLTPQETDTVVAIREAMQDMIASLQQLNPNGYFEVEGWGRVRVSEIIALLTRADWEIHPERNLPGLIGDVVRNDGDPRMRVNRDWLLPLWASPSLLHTFLMHEIAHATRVGHRSVNPLDETIANDLARQVLLQVGKPNAVYANPRHGYGAASVTYVPNLPVT